MRAWRRLGWRGLPDERGSPPERGPALMERARECKLVGTEAEADAEALSFVGTCDGMDEICLDHGPLSGF